MWYKLVFDIWYLLFVYSVFGIWYSRLQVFVVFGIQVFLLFADP